jgi:NitT/TauT family transport system substrate-binding protein
MLHPCQNRARKEESSMKKSIFFPTLLICLFMLLQMAGCAPKGESNAQEPLEIAVNSWPGFLPVILADELGYFNEEEVNVKYFYSENSRQQRLDFESGAYDGITLSLGSLIAVSGKAPDTRIIFLTDISTTGDAVVVSPEIKSVADLQGKRIVLGAAGYGEVVVSVMLEQAGLTGNDVIWVAMQDENEALEMLKDGRVDAFQTWEPFVTRAVQDGANVIFTGADVPGLIPDAMGFHDKTLQERPEDVLAFMRGWFRAVDFWLANPDEATQILSDAVGLSPEELSIAGMELLTLERNQQFYQPGDDFSSAYYAAQVYTDFFTKNGVITTSIEIYTILDNSFLLQLP